MRRFRTKIPIIVACAMVACVSLSYAQVNKPLVLSTGEDYAPLTSSELERGGLATWIVLRSLELGNIKVGELRWEPWKRGYESVSELSADATFPYGPGDETKRRFLLSVPFIHVQRLAWVKTGNAIETLEDMSGKTLCLPRGYHPYDVVQKLIRAGAVRMTPNTMEQCFRLLSRGRVDIVASTEFDAAGAIKSSELSRNNFRSTGIILHRIPFHFIVSKKHPDGRAMIDGFNAGFKKLEQSGELERLKSNFKWPSSSTN